MKYLIFLILTLQILLFISIKEVSSEQTANIVNQPNAEDNDQKLNLTIFYAVSCPYCINFFKSQLPRLFDNKTQLYQYVNFDLVPFVQNAYKEDGNWTYECMHGPEECQYTQLHACILQQMSSNQNDKNYVKSLIQFIICLMDTKYEVQELPKCISRYHIQTSDIHKCLDDVELVGKLMSGFVKRREDNNPPVDFVPWIQFNGVFNKNESTTAEEDIIKGVCKHLKPQPEECTSVHKYYRNVFNESESSAAHEDIIKGVCTHLNPQPEKCKSVVQLNNNTNDNDNNSNRTSVI